MISANKYNLLKKKMEMIGTENTIMINDLLKRHTLMEWRWVRGEQINRI